MTTSEDCANGRAGGVRAWRRAGRRVWTLAWVAVVSAAAPAAAQPLQLDDVLESATTHYPSVLAASARVDVATAELLAARGGFDPQFNVYGAIRVGGYYELRRIKAELRQALPVMGAEVFVGYRLGLGVDEEGEQRYPTYYSDETLERGELSLGVRVPLLRDRALDSRRAAPRRAEAYQQGAQEREELTLLDVRRQAMYAYFSWVAAGRALALAERLLTLATDRQSFVAIRIAEGLSPDIDRLEAERAVLSRRLYVLRARRKLEAAALVLALYHRDGDGRPSLATVADLPPTLPDPPSLGAPDASIEEALVCHPSLGSARASVAAATVSRDLAQAQRAPRLDLTASFSRDFGRQDPNLARDPTLPGNVFEAGLTFSVPLANRAPRGRLQAANASLAVQQRSLELAEDQLRLSLRDAVSAYRTAEEALALTTATRQNAEALAAAEASRFEAGNSTLFLVNQREQNLISTSVAEVQTVAELWSAHARWIALSSCDP